MTFPQGIPPLIRTPLTDFSALLGLPDIQICGRTQCRKFEMQYFNCLEAYGIEKGYQVCSALYEDLLECKYNFKQNARLQRIKQEMDKQVKQGKRSYSKPPELDSYYEVRF